MLRRLHLLTSCVLSAVAHGLSQRAGACWLLVRCKLPLTADSCVPVAQALLWDKKLNLWQQTRLLSSYQKRISDPS
jgi:hypothetical protein